MKHTKKTIALILAVLMLFSLVSCKATFKKRFGDYTPLLWYVEKDGNRVWLFGSIHIGIEDTNDKNDMYPMPSAVWDAFTSSKYICVESDIIELEKDLEATQQMIACLLFDDGTSLGSIMKIEDRNRMNEAMFKLGYSQMELGYTSFMPILASMFIDELTLDKTDFDSYYGVDNQMLLYAKANGIAVKEIEDPFETYRQLATLPLDTQLYLLNQTVDMILDENINFQAEFDELFRHWANGTIFEHYESDEDYEDEEQELHNERYNEIMLYNRNAGMTDKIEEYLATGETHFFVVGVLHYPGEKGIIQMLKDRGYTPVAVPVKK